VLLAQDRLSELEAQLERLDGAERHRINLASRRHDMNEDRADLLRRMGSALQEYGAYARHLRRVSVNCMP
jgi:copper chaperone CopZ